MGQSRLSWEAHVSVATGDRALPQSGPASSGIGWRAPVALVLSVLWLYGIGSLAAVILAATALRRGARSKAERGCSTPLSRRDRRRAHGRELRAARRRHDVVDLSPGRVRRGHIDVGCCRRGCAMNMGPTELGFIGVIGLWDRSARARHLGRHRCQPVSRHGIRARIPARRCGSCCRSSASLRAGSFPSSRRSCGSRPTDRRS